jgi:hypothetical protein
VSPQLRRYLPFILLALLALFILPQLFNGSGGGKTLSTNDRAALAFDAIDRIHFRELDYRKANAKFSNRLADLVALDPILAQDLQGGFAVDLDASLDGKTYLARLTSDTVALVRTNRVRDRICRILRSNVDFSCDKPPTLKPDTTTTVSTTTTTTTTG